MTHRRSVLVPFAAAALVLVTAACGGSEASISAPDPAATAAPAVASSKTPTESLGTVPPAEVSALPDGVYRTQLSREKLSEIGADELGTAGTWTLTIAAGTFRLECVPLSNPGTDCGGNQATGPDGSMVEIGTVRGTDNTVWMVHDGARRSELKGCVRRGSGADGCGPEGGYRMTWEEVSGQVDGLAFSDYVGLGEEAGPPLANWVGQPWTRLS